MFPISIRTPPEALASSISNGDKENALGSIGTGESTERLGGSLAVISQLNSA
jgi:hypothetical protein